MANITISAGSFPDYKGDGTALELRAYSNGFTDAAGVYHAPGSPYDAKTVGNFFRAATLTKAGTTLSFSSFVMPSTTDSVDRPASARWSFYIFETAPAVRRVAPVNTNGQPELWIAPTPTTQALSDVIAANAGVVASTPYDAAVSGGLSVAGTSTFDGPVEFNDTVSGAVKSFNGRDGEVELQSSDLNGLSADGMTGLGTGTGSVINTGTTTVGADSDADGVGVVVLQTRGLTRATVNNDGVFEVSRPLRLARFPTISIPAGLEAHFIFDTDRGLPAFHDGNSWRYIHGRVMFDLRQDGGAAGDDSTSDTDEFNDVAAEIVTAGGGAMFLPMPPGGGYLMGGSLNPTTNSLIYPPQNPWGGVGDTVSIPFALIGEAPPTWGDYGVQGSGVVIRTNVAGSGTYPAIFSAKAWAAFVDSETQYQSWNYLHIDLQNLLFRTFDNPSIGAVNLSKCHRASARRVVCDVGVIQDTPAVTKESEPTHDTYGIMFPQVESNGSQSMQDVTVVGYRTGYYAADHFRAEGFIMACRCRTGWHFENIAGTGSGFLYDYRSLHTLLIEGNVNKLAFRIHKEAEADAGTWNSVTPGTTVDMEDVGDTAEGWVEFYNSALHTSPPSVTSNYAPVPDGMNNVRFKAMHQVGQQSTFRRTASQNIPTATPTEINWTLDDDNEAHVSHVANNKTIGILLPGDYRIEFKAALVTTASGTVDNGTGYRQAGITISDDGYATSSLIAVETRAAVTGQQTAISVSREIRLTRGHQLRAYVNHNAGVDLSVIGGASIDYSPVLTITRL